ncbi:7TM diverse intracellular signaling domain-containing protein [Algivirga pacifica]|uniref:PPM-type phosphatase domain-containing protein n=1 Tax=Algivirga pacifica TaxID=1162670 RepID=A0ABP9DLQ2_9BACT
MRFYTYIVNFFHLLILILLTTGNGVSQTIEKGVLDLREKNLQKEVIRLDGEWAFYWEQLVTYETLDTLHPTTYYPVPATWQAPYTAEGYASYHLRILLPDNHPTQLGLKVQTASTAYSIYINGKCIDQAGIVAMNEEEGQEEFSPKAIYFVTDKDTLDVLVQVSNYSYKKGGLWREFKLGSVENIQSVREYAIMNDMMLFGGFLVIGAYFLVLYFLRRQELSSLLYALGCFCFGLRELTTEEYLLHYWFPSIPWNALIRLEYLSFIGAIIIFPNLYQNILKGLLNPIVVKLTAILGGIYLLILLTTPPEVFTNLPSVGYGTIALFCVYLIYITGMSVVRYYVGGKLLLLGGLIIFGATTNDFLISLGVIDTMPLMSIALLLFMFVLAVLISYQYNLIFNQNEQLTVELNEMNSSLEEKVEERTIALSDVNEQLQEKSKVLEKQHESINSSIKYARRIQTAALPSVEKLNTILGEGNYSMLYLPRDIISGDFYFVEEIQQKKIIVIADCTGHGVPGALMSMLGVNLLTDIVMNRHILQPDEVISEMHQGIQKALQQYENNVTDGMDLAVCLIDEEEGTLTYAGAHTPLYYIDHNGEEHYIKGDRFGIGGNYLGDRRIFKAHVLSLSKIHTWFTYSDGFQDQFGGMANRKVMGKRFREILKEEVAHHAIVDLEYHLKRFIRRWMAEGKEKQLDDILVFGMTGGRK